MLQAALGIRENVTVFGSDYPTSDGSCIRDYIHVMDLASAHRLAADRLRNTRMGAEAYNLGIGKGYSVMEVIETARTVTQREIPVVLGERREGDPAVLVAAPDLAKRVLQWEPNYQGLSGIIESAWKWHLSQPNGYSG